MPKQLRVSYVQDGDEENITVYHGGKTYVAHNTHPAWDRIFQGVLVNDDPAVLSLFDIGLAVGEHKALSDRVSYADGRLFLDGDELGEGLPVHIIRMVQDGEDFAPFVALLENILANPSDNSREQLFRYIDQHHITITLDGQLILYKYLRRWGDQASDQPAYRSDHAGPAIVNGNPDCQNPEGHVLQDIGDTVTMPRSKVMDNPQEACSTGLHTGAWGYVGTGGDLRVAVLVHPRDVVSVPRDAQERKVRVCRYKILHEVDQAYEESVYRPEDAPEDAPETPQEATGVSEQPEGKHPSTAAFMRLRAKAKTQKKSVKALAKKAKVGAGTLHGRL